MSRTSKAFDINSANWSNKYIFPEMIYIDTNAAIDILQQRPLGSITESYVKELYQRDGMIVWSQYTIDEITQVIHVDEYFQLARAKNIRGGKPWKIAENTATDTESVTIAQQVLTRVENATMYLENYGIKTEVDGKQVNELTRLIYKTYGNNLQDSRHFAIANLSGINDILSQDSGFLRFPNVNVFGASQELVSNYTTNQRGAEYIDLSNVLLPKPKIDSGESEEENAS